ncbi:class D beta-lactamase [Acuticoccus sp. M5D2P5]|uniref:class D beta-lactamase n=1 Tax=Acuticoccus kalidii TaxID=2910977 RepID=UPI001EFF329E|nr:class D beta-lactamase [Acuticoccus kalidii]MCF3936063.1 class D beta-lactamase [Acuticoccus kalidii]
MKTWLLAAGLAVTLGSTGYAADVCTIVADASDGRILVEEGDCASRVTPASTFKIPLALMGYDAGILSDAHAPVLPFREGYLTWGGEAWKQPTDPARWMKYSVVWFSQEITPQLGAERIEAYLDAFGFGNADMAGDPGEGNGLDRAWISSSLQISPREQVVFLQALVDGTLPVSASARAHTMEIVEAAQLADGWIVHGKTGAAMPKGPDGRWMRGYGWGWFVGWAEGDGRVLVFAKLIKDEGNVSGSPGKRARAAFLEALPARLATDLAP